MKTYHQKNKGIFKKKLERDEISALERAEKSLFPNFDHYDLTTCKEFLHEIWCICTLLS